jgi:hypothetical protein
MYLDRYHGRGEKMSWYNVNYACGHSDRMQVYGPTKDRQDIADREGRKDCPDCWRKAQDERNAAATLQAQADNTAAGLPTLTGSTRQIAWAETIRAAAKANIEAAIGNYEQAVAFNSMLSAPRAIPPLADLIAFAARVMRQAGARYWIDRREEFGDPRSTGSYLFRRTAEEHAKQIGAAMLTGAQNEHQD